MADLRRPSFFSGIDQNCCVFSIHSRPFVNPDYRKILFIHFNESPLGMWLTLSEERPNFAGLKNSKFCNFENRPMPVGAGRPFSVPTTNFVAIFTSKSYSKPNLSNFRIARKILKINIWSQIVHIEKQFQFI